MNSDLIAVLVFTFLFIFLKGFIERLSQAMYKDDQKKQDRLYILFWLGFIAIIIIINFISG